MDSEVKHEKLFEKALSVSKLSLKKILALYVMQNLYVTEECEPTLSLALGLHPGVDNHIKDFIKEESGHDILLKRSIASLTKNSTDINLNDTPVLKSIIKVMDHFKYTAQNNLLAFCFMVDMFERDEENSSVAHFLELIGEKKAASPLKTHSKINHEGGHANESFNMLSEVGTLSQLYLKQGIELAEVGSNLMKKFMIERNNSCQKLIN